MEERREKIYRGGERVLKNTSQMRIICTQTGESICLFIPLRQLLSWGWHVSVGMYVQCTVHTYIYAQHTVCGLVTKFIFTKFIRNKI